jgi:hypothetical protein
MLMGLRLRRRRIAATQAAGVGDVGALLENTTGGGCSLSRFPSAPASQPFFVWLNAELAEGDRDDTVGREGYHRVDPAQAARPRPAESPRVIDHQ